jgi:hypothetical protein
MVLLRGARLCTAASAAILMVAFASVSSPIESRVAAATGIRATRLRQNPLITVNSSPTVGDNVNGPTVVRVPSWVQKPLGRYYMYFAHHTGAHIRLAYADAIEGPWKIHDPGVLNVRDTAFFRPQPDPPNSPEGFYTHVASPEIHVDDANRKIVMWFHGWWTAGSVWPLESVAAARAWARDKGYGQFTQVAESTDGLHFTVHAPITRESYLRVFREAGMFYGIARLGILSRAKSPLETFELGPNAFRDTAYAGRVRHVALLRQNRTMNVFFSGIGDAPEHIMMSTIDLSGDWSTWRASAPIDVLTPETAYECPDLPNVPSQAGEIEGRAKQMRDPAIFEENGRRFLFYTICGEQGVGAAEIEIKN